MKIFIKLVVLLICIVCIASGRTITSAETDTRNISRISVSNNVPIVTNTNIFVNGHTAKIVDNTDSDWLSSWMYRKSHIISSSTGAGTNYQVRIRVNYGSGIDNGENVYLGSKCKTDFGDVRFTDDDETTPLDFWIQEQVDRDYALFWVEVTDDLETASRTIYIYYGKNDVTTTSNGDSTFIFFDDFIGDLSKWELQSSSGIYPQIESNYLRCGGGSLSDPYGWTCLGSQPTYTAFQNNAIEFRYRVATNAICEVSFRGNYVNNTGYKARSDQRPGEGQSFLKPPYRVGVWGFITGRDGDLPSIDVWYRGTITAYGSTFKLYRDNILKSIATDIDYSGPGQISLQNHYGSYTDYDWVAVRKFTDPEPTHGSWGNEDSLFFTITATAVGYGTIIPSGQLIINNGSDTTLYITADIGYHTDSVVVDGIDQGTPSNYTFNTVTDSHTIIAYFSINTYDITATADDGGMISPAGSITVNYGSDTTFIITSDIGYHISNVLVDNSSVGAVSNYTFTDITEDHTINATFEINTYTLNVSTIGNGNVTVVPEQLEYEYGTEVTLTAESEEDWTFSGWSGDVTSSDNPLMVIMDNNKSITATFTYNGIFGWSQIIDSMPSNDPKPNKYVKDGGSMVTVDDSIDGIVIYAFRGNKSKEFYAYSPGTPGDWTELETIPYGLKPTDPTRINKKKVGKGASLCYDDDNNIIYATKGNSTREFWAYDIEGDSWIAKAFLPYTPVKGLKGGTSIAYYDYDNKVYLLAGGQKVDSSNFFVYTPQADTPNGTPWVALTQAPITPHNKSYKDGSCITLLDGEIYFLKGGDKHNFFFKYDIETSNWSHLETIPLLYPVNLIASPKKKKVKDGGAMTNDGEEIYVIKGGGTQDLWRYTPGDPGIWTALDTIPRLNKKSVPKSGAALTYGNGKLYLLKGNNTPELWQYTPPFTCYMPRINNHNYNVIQTLAIQSKNIKTTMYVTPNPCTKLAAIHYSVPIAGKVTLKLYNSSGRLVETLINNCVNTGVYTVRLPAARFAKGVYFLKYQTTTHQEDIKLIIQ